jgi:hypothetical protein
MTVNPLDRIAANLTSFRCGIGPCVRKTHGPIVLRSYAAAGAGFGASRRT